MENMKALFIIVNSGFADDIIDIAHANGACGATILNARGEGFAMEKILGITVDCEREIVLTLVDEGVAEKIMAAVKEKAGIKTPAHGICFMISIDKMTEIR